MPLKTIQEQLPSNGFIRIHKSYIILIPFFIAVRKASVFIDTLELPVSDNYRNNITTLSGKL